MTKKIESDNKLVDLYSLKQPHFNPRQVHKLLSELNAGKDVDKKTVVKMLYQAYREMLEYRSIITSVGYHAQELQNLFKYHQYAFEFLKGRKGSGK